MACDRVSSVTVARSASLARRVRILVTDRDVESATGTRYEKAFERAFDAIVIVDDNGRYVDANQSACDLLGLTRSKLLAVVRRLPLYWRMGTNKYEERQQ